MWPQDINNAELRELSAIDISDPKFTYTRNVFPILNRFSRLRANIVHGKAQGNPEKGPRPPKGRDYEQNPEPKAENLGGKHRSDNRDNRLPKSKGNPKKTVCWNCVKEGHRTNDCPQAKAYDRIQYNRKALAQD